MQILDGEEINFEESNDAVMMDLPDEEINEKYVRGEIRIVTEQARYPLNTIATIVSSDEYKLSPEYQRRHRWSVKNQSRLIESLIMNVPIPPIFLYEYEYSKYEVMDGLQRLTAIHDFYEDMFQLEGLSQWPELNGKRYSNLPTKVREGIDRRYLSSVILLKETAKNEEDALRLKQMVFERINSGGASLTHQESRNAIYDGPLNRLCIKLSKNRTLCQLWGIPEPDDEELRSGTPSDERLEHESYRRMDDVELVLRFFAYRQKHRLHKGTPLSVYFDNYLRHGNFMPVETLEQLEQLFTETITLVNDVFGARAFWLWRSRKNGNWSWYERATTAVYDPLMLITCENLNRAEELRLKSAEIQNSMQSFYQENAAEFMGRNVNPSSLAVREECFRRLFAETLDS